MWDRSVTVLRSAGTDAKNAIPPLFGTWQSQDLLHLVLHSTDDRAKICNTMCCVLQETMQHEDCQPAPRRALEVGETSGKGMTKGEKVEVCEELQTGVSLFVETDQSKRITLPRFKFFRRPTLPALGGIDTGIRRSRRTG